MNRKLLIYRLEDIDHYQTIRHLCHLLDIEIVEITDQMIHLRLQDLLNHKISKRKNKSLAMPMVVFSGFTSDQIDTLLNTFKNGNVPFIPLKATVTGTNLKWSFERLFDDLFREYQQIVQKTSKR